MRNAARIALAGVAGALLATGACSGGDAPETAAARGRKIYENTCTTCHAADPSRDGSIGPAIAGSSAELLEAKLVHGTYPPGYTPKRESALMPKLPHLEPYVGDLAAFLQNSHKAREQ